MKRILITGAAGFIGFHAALQLRKRGDFVIGLDNFNHYYAPSLKQARCQILNQDSIDVVRADICDCAKLKELLEQHEITHVIHLAAQAGVRHSMKQPGDYVTSNLQGFASILEACRAFPHIKLIYASSSSVYGLNRTIPFHIDDPTDSPANLYGATKIANEAMAHAYHHLYGISVTALRYFTAYGPWGRPDMAYYRFTKDIFEGHPIPVYNYGLMRRDFTYVDDIVAGTIAALDLGAPCERFNLGGHRPVDLLYLIQLLEEAIGKPAITELLPAPPGEVMETYADIEKSERLLNFRPAVSLEEGVSRFVEWYKEYELALTPAGIARG
jgi:UDP-glucuronate 4-epimerase